MVRIAYCGASLPFAVSVALGVSIIRRSVPRLIALPVFPLSVRARFGELLPTHEDPKCQ